MKMIPFYKPNINIDSVGPSVVEALRTGQVTNWGAKTSEFENRLSSYLEREVVLLASGTHALTFGLLGMASLDMIPKFGARILVPSFTFYASVHAILWAGMTPVFCDIYPDTFTIDISKATSYYDAVMPVNVFGVQHGLSPHKSDTNKPIIGDLSHGFGGTKSGTKNGQLEEVACFSTSITKPMQSIEGGILASNSDVVSYVRKFRNWGSPYGKYDCEISGQWSKITEINSIVGLSSLEYLEESLATKNTIATMYKHYLKNSVEFQNVPGDTTTTYKDFAVLLPSKESRDRASGYLEECHIGSKQYFYPPVHKMKCFGGEYDSLHLPVTNDISDRILCLPIYDSISEDEVRIVSEAVLSSLNGKL
jgi:dTDP-4-amino-4,6-dideoxygalactose transaminase